MIDFTGPRGPNATKKRPGYRRVVDEVERLGLVLFPGDFRFFALDRVAFLANSPRPNCFLSAFSLASFFVLDSAIGLSVQIEVNDEIVLCGGYNRQIDVQKQPEPYCKPEIKPCDFL